MKDRQQLDKYRSQFRGTAPEQALITEYLNNSVSNSSNSSSKKFCSIVLFSCKIYESKTGLNEEITRRLKQFLPFAFVFASFFLYLRSLFVTTLHYTRIFFLQHNKFRDMLQEKKLSSVAGPITELPSCKLFVTPTH